MLLDSGITVVELRVPRSSAVENPRSCDDVWNIVFLSVSHDVYTIHAFNFSNLLNQIDTQLNAFGFLIFCAFKSINNAIRYMHTGYIFSRSVRGACLVMLRNASCI